MELSDANGNRQEGVSDLGEGSGPAALLAGEPEGVRQSFGLSPKQRIALEARLAGASQVEAARLAGVHDSTVSRWMNDDPKFIAAFNARTLELIKSEQVAAATLLPLANAAVRQSLQAGNGWLGIHYLRYMESMKSQALPTTAKAVREEKKLAQQIHEAELMKKQLQLQEQQLEIEKLKVKLDRRDDEKKIEEAKHEGYWYAMTAFYSVWSRERDKPLEQHNAQLAKQDQEERQDREKYERAKCEWSDEKCRQIIAEADRLQQQDQEKKQRGLRVKSAEQQLIELHNRTLRADKQRGKERDSQEHAPNEPQPNEPPPAEPQPAGPSADDQPAEDRRAAGQQSSNHPQPTPDSPRLKEPREVDLWEADHEEADEETDSETEEQEVTEHRPADDQRPAETEKPNPDAAPIDPRTLAQDGPFDPPGLAQNDPDERTEGGCAREAREKERNGT